MVAVNQGSAREPETQLQACTVAGERAIQEHRWPDAVKWFGQAARLAADDTKIAGQLAFALSRDQQYARAIDVLQALHERESRLARWPYMIGFQFYMQSQWSDAVIWFQKALDILPDYLIVLYRKGYAHLRLGEADAAAELFRRCIAVWKTFGDEAKLASRSCYSDAGFQLGKLYLGQGLTFKAREPLALAVEHDGNNAYKRYEFGKCLLAMGDADAAISELQRANDLDPSLDYVKDRLAQAYMAVGELHEADHLYASIPDFRRREYVLRNMGRLYCQLGRYSEAAELLRRAIRKEYQNHHSHYSLGLAYEGLSNWPGAHQAYKEAIRIRQDRYGRSYPEAEGRLTILQDKMTAEGISPDSESNTSQAFATLGVIESYNRQRGFGFIRSGVGERLFFHVSALPEGCSVEEGEKSGVRCFRVAQGTEGHQPSCCVAAGTMGGGFGGTAGRLPDWEPHSVYRSY
jgi:tetratricopeptide (TPR) repeat protein